MENAAREAEDCIEAGGGTYFRRLNSRPEHLRIGDRCYYVEDAYVRGFAIVNKIEYHKGWTCETTGYDWHAGWYVEMDARSWRWIQPIPMRGFQGWRYFTQPVKILGGWREPKPEITFPACKHVDQEDMFE